MARMLGRFRRGGCGNFACRLCGPGDVRWNKRREQHEVTVVIEEEARRPIIFDEYDLAVIGMFEEDPAEAERLRGECRHHCNGDEIVSGHESEACDFTCHPGLAVDPERAARYDAIMDEIEARP